MFIPPLKPVKIPERLIYCAPKNNYRMFSTKNGSYLGVMKATVCELVDDSFYKDAVHSKSLYINSLKVFPFARRQGIGSELLKFAEKLSLRNNAEGRVHLIAYNADNPAQAPQIFYRKYGFSTTSAAENKMIDEAIENNTPVPAFLTQGSCMFLEKTKKI